MGSEMKHTPEPWHVSSVPKDGLNNPAIQSFELYPRLVAVTTDNKDFDERLANAKRIVACVNACSGVENPDEYLQSARDAISTALQIRNEHEALKKECDRLRAEVEALLRTR